jgi:hypothetical protein
MNAFSSSWQPYELQDSRWKQINATLVVGHRIGSVDTHAVLAIGPALANTTLLCKDQAQGVDPRRYL